ncbi:hypothetical protein Y1Q_0024587 [Alligator mississippiensis]|uniref:Uncharacterized protein n=1 Tax=Alligator mississippiensis TaxID=8496 RepID=A0A151NAX3_ALLMI|nr:hypothetical protein Y1Q_0024587 [Alligator mississippiensis]
MCKQTCLYHESAISKIQRKAWENDINNGRKGKLNNRNEHMKMKMTVTEITDHAYEIKAKDGKFGKEPCQSRGFQSLSIFLVLLLLRPLSLGLQYTVGSGTWWNCRPFTIPGNH